MIDTMTRLLLTFLMRLAQRLGHPRWLRKVRIALAITFSQPLYLPGISGGAYDAADMLRASTAGNLTATETLPANPGNQIDGTPVHGVTMRLHVPAFVAASTLDAKIQDSADGTTWADRLIFPQINAATQIGETRRRLATSKKFIRYVMTVAGGGANFGVVQFGPDSAGEQAEW